MQVEQQEEVKRRNRGLFFLADERDQKWVPMQISAIHEVKKHIMR